MAEKRMSLRITQEQFSKMSELKKESFYDRTWSDLIRYVVDEGLKVLEKARTEK